MDLSNKIVWQQAAGDTDRNYTALCLKWDVILNGPGGTGSWPACKTSLVKANISSRKITDLKRFCEDMQENDLVVLRLGTKKVVAVGEVVGQYEWCDAFADVDGWDIQHTRRVRWLWKRDQGPPPPAFTTYSLKQGDTTQKLDSAAVTDWLSSLTIPDEAHGRPLEPLPKLNMAENAVTMHEISEYLFDHGVASTSIERLLAEIGELTRIAKWYQRSKKPSEHETVAYLVIPLLRALGWTPQKMAIEWSFVDVALFHRLPRTNDNLSVVVEAKKMDASCLSATAQARDYTKTRRDCHRFIVTDGLRYGVYVKKDSGNFDLYAYMNLTCLRGDYPIYGCKGAREALLAMAPEWKHTP